MTSFWTKLLQNDVVLALIKNKIKRKRRRFVSGRNETTSFHMAVSPKSKSPVLVFQFAAVLGEGGMGGRKRGPAAGGRSLHWRAHF